MFELPGDITEPVQTSTSLPYIIQNLPSPIKSANDKKEYKVIRLENRLTALLISDLQDGNVSPEHSTGTEDDSSEEGSDTGSGPGSRAESPAESDLSEKEDSESGSEPDFRSESPDRSGDESKSYSVPKEEKLAALALCVGVGSFSDPWEIQGMAHFLEHMMFMGSGKYPKENDFDAFIKKSGGSDNAETNTETTTFYFECHDRHLMQAIDKFSQFFISPLMKREAMTREREAIESEFRMGVTSDENRRQQLLCSLAYSENPVRKFTWGNLITLRDNVSDDKLYETVHEFRNRHYSAHRMTLAVQARLPIETLEPWIKEYFSAVPFNDEPAEDFTKYTSLAFNTPEFRKMYWVKPVKDACEVELTWALPSMIPLYRFKPGNYVEELVGHEGKGSLLSFLRKKVWALGIYAGCDEDDGCCNNAMFSLFTITIALTDEGFLHLREVLDAVFGYLKMIQRTGPSDSFFRELQSIQDTKFRFSEEVPPDENVEALATNMHYYPPEDYIQGPELFFEYNPDVISKFLQALKPDDVNIMISKKDPGRGFDKVEPWFQTEYAVTDIPNDWLESWSKTEPDPSFTMPAQSIFLTTDFSILPFEGEEENNPHYPVKIQDNELSEVWYRRDTKFKLPQAFFYFYILSPLALTTSKNAAMLDLYAEILKQMLVEEMYPGQVADLYCALYAGDKGLVIKLKGYNQKLPLLLEAVVNGMARFEDNLTNELFEAVKEVQVRTYYNTFLKPEKLNKDLRLSLLLKTHWSAVDKHGAVSDVTLASMKEFAHMFPKRMYVLSLFQGNLTKHQAIDVCNKISGILKYSPPLPDTTPEIRVMQIPAGEYCCRVKSFNQEDSNSTVTNYYQSNIFDISNYCIVELLMMLMEEPVFDILRTKEQLGYHVYSSLRYTFGVVGFSVTVNYQAVKFSVEFVDQRIETFLESFAETLKKTQEEELAEVRNSLIKLKKLSDIHLKEEVNRNWEEIASREYMFDRMKLEIGCLEGIEIGTIRNWFNDHMIFGSKTNFRKLSVQVVGASKKSKKEKVEVQVPQVNRIRRGSIKDRNQSAEDLRSRSSSSVSITSQDSIPQDAMMKFPLQFIRPESKKRHSSRQFISSIEGFKSGLTVFPAIKVQK